MRIHRKINTALTDIRIGSALEGPHLQNEKCCVEPSCSELLCALPPQSSLSTLWGPRGYTVPLWFQDNLPFLISTEQSVISLESLWPLITPIQSLSISWEAYVWGYGSRIEHQPSMPRHWIGVTAPWKDILYQSTNPGRGTNVEWSLG